MMILNCLLVLLDCIVLASFLHTEHSKAACEVVVKDNSKLSVLICNAAKNVETISASRAKARKEVVEMVQENYRVGEA